MTIIEPQQCNLIAGAGDPASVAPSQPIGPRHSLPFTLPPTEP